MVWGAINSNFLSSLIVVSHALTARRYIDHILAAERVPLLRRHQNPFTFLQDNARPHTARLTQYFLAINQVNVMSFPARSPDLNPIKHVWDALGRRVKRRQRQPVNLAELATALQEE